MKKDEKTNGSRRDYLFSCLFACWQWLETLIVFLAAVLHFLYGRILEKFTGQNKPNQNYNHFVVKINRLAFKVLAATTPKTGSRCVFLPVSHQVSATERNSSKRFEPDHLRIRLRSIRRHFTQRVQTHFSFTKKVEVLALRALPAASESRCELPVSSQIPVIAALRSSGGTHGCQSTPR